MTAINIYTKLATLPDDLKKEVEDFVDFLKSKTNIPANPAKVRRAGLAKGLIKMKKDFDAPLDDLSEYMS